MLDRKKELIYKEIRMPRFIKPKVFELKNGIPVYALEGGDQELCRVELVFEAGTKVQSKKLQAAMCNAMLFEGTRNKCAEDIHGELDFYGAYTQLDVNSDRAIVSLYTMNRYFDNVLPVFMDAIENAVFPENEFKVILEQRKQAFRINSEKVEYQARNTFFKTIFDGHAYGALAKQEDFDSISREDLVSFHEAFYKNAALKIYISGKVPSTIEDQLNTQLSSWNIKPESTINSFQPELKNKRIHISKEGAMQSAIRIGRVCFNSHHEDFYQLKFLSVLLGGYFGSRLMSNIREDKGLTYGIGAVCIHQEESGYFSISTEVKREGTEIALQEIYRELKRLREELIPEEELHLVKNYVMGQILKSADGPFAQATVLKNMHIQKVGFEFYERYQLMLDNLNANELQKMAKKYLSEEMLCEVVVGNTSC